jgi:type I restriction enzyme S subunit
MPTDRTRLDWVATVNARIGWKALTAAEYQEDGYAFLSTPNIKSEHIDFENVNYISEFRYRESPELMLKGGDVLLAKDGSTLGIVNVVRDLPRAATVNGSIAVIRPFGIDSRYLMYVLRAAPTQDWIQQVKDGMGVPHLFQADIKKFKLPLPPEEEQRRIADFLDDQVARIDNIIAARRQQLTLVRQEGRSQVDAVLSAAGEQCPVKYLISSITSGPRGWGDLVADEGRPFLRIGNLPRDGVTLRLEDLVFVNVEDNVETRRATVKLGDVLIGITASLGDVALVEPNLVGATFSQHVARLRPLSGTTDPTWLAWVMQTSRTREALTTSGYGGTKVGLGLSDVANVRVPRISLVDQRAAAQSASTAWASHLRWAEALERSVGALNELRRSLITATVTGVFDVASASGSGVRA